MSKYSLVICLLLGSTQVLAQSRTPTSPLDQADRQPAPTNPVPDPPSAPVSNPSPASPVVQRTPGVGRFPTSAAVAGGPRLSLEELLPEGVRSPTGLSEADAVNLAREHSVRARRANAAVSAADAGVNVARLGFLPSVSASLRYTRLSSYAPGTLGFFNTPGCIADLAACQADPSSFQEQVVLQEPILNQYAAQVSVNVPLSSYLGQHRQALRAARADSEAAYASREASLDELELTVIESYWQVVRARAQLSLAEDAQSVAQRRAEEAQQRAQTGAATELDALASRAQVRSYEQLTAVAQNRMDLAEATLRDLLGMDDSAALHLSAELASLDDVQELPIAELRARAANTAAVRAADAQARAADARSDAQRSALFPTLSAGFNLDYANPNQRIFPQTTDFTATWDASVQLAWSLDGAVVGAARLGQQRALAEEQRLAAEEARETQGRTAIAAQGTVVAALAGVDAQQLNAAAAITRASHVNAQRDAGLSTELELREAESQTLSARLDLVDALADAHIAVARLQNSLGVDALETP